MTRRDTQAMEADVSAAVAHAQTHGPANAPHMAAGSANETNQEVAPQPIAPPPIKWVGIQLPESMANVVRALRRETNRMRAATVKALPAFVVNNSSNILGGAHVATEIAMFKASMKEGNLIQNPENPINWVVQPISTVFKGVAEGAKPKDLNIKELFSGDPIKNIRERTVDTQAATAREYTRQLKENPNAKVVLSNRWQTRATFAGLVAWSLSALLPEKKESPDEIERMAIMKINHPMQYAGERLKQAVWVPEWHKHKRQMLGLAYMGIGLCSMLGAWRGRKTVNAEREFDGIKTFVKHEYSFNRDYFMTSLLSLSSSFPLMFALDEKSGYSNFGGIMMGRMAFLPGSIRRKYKDGDPGAGWYAGSTLSFQVENMMQGLFGGAQKVKRKLPDGTEIEVVIDHKDMLEKAKAEAHEIKRQKRVYRADGSEVMADEAQDVAGAMQSTLSVGADGKLVEQKSSLAVNEKGELKESKPTAKVTQAEEVAFAMPERVARGASDLATA